MIQKLKNTNEKTMTKDLIYITLAMVILIFINSPIILVAILFKIYIMTLKNPLAGVAAFLTILPAENFIVQGFPLAITTTTGIVILAATFIRPRITLPPIRIMSIYAFFFGWALFTHIVSKNNIGFNYYMIYIIALLLSLLVAWIILLEPKSIRILAKGVLFSVVVAFLLGTFDIQTLGRLSYNSSTRTVANGTGLAAFFLFYAWIVGKLGNGRTLFDYKRYGILFAATMSIVVLSSNRGVLMATIAAIIASLVFSKLFELKERRVSFNFRRFIKFATIIVLVIATIILVDNLFMGGNFINERVLERLYEVAPGSRENIRYKIWGAALSQLNEVELMIGTGLSSFRQHAISGGMDYYAHSLFVDLIVTQGLLAFLVLMLFIIKIIYKLFNKKDSFGLGLVTYIIVSYYTFGAIHNAYQFWILIGIVYGLSQRKMIKGNCYAEN